MCQRLILGLDENQNNPSQDRQLTNLDSKRRSPEQEATFGIYFLNLTVCMG
jgi:hypothetical protein